MILTGLWMFLKMKFYLTGLYHLGYFCITMVELNSYHRNHTHHVRKAKVSTIWLFEITLSIHSINNDTTVLSNLTLRMDPSMPTECCQQQSEGGRERGRKSENKNCFLQAWHILFPSVLLDQIISRSHYWTNNGCQKTC